MARVFADKRFVGVWKCKTKIKEIIYNQANLNFPDEITKIISISNTQGGTIMYFGQPSPTAKGIPASRASGIAVEFILKGQHQKYVLTEIFKINVVDNANLIGESTQDWVTSKEGSVAKVITRSEYHRVGRMKTS